METNWYSQNFRLGILGGGQLGRMLIQEAINLNIHVDCMDSDPNAPCSTITKSFVCGSITNFDSVYEFGKNKSILTVEIEDVSVEALEQLEKEGVKVFPQPRVLRIIRDKGLQKEFYEQNSLPTASFSSINSRTDLLKVEKFPVVQKLRTGGYDGKGVQILKSIEDVQTSFDAPSIIEEMISFKKELSVIVARNEKGEKKCFPIVECEFNSQLNLVEFLFSPAQVSNEVATKAMNISMEVIEKLNMVGLLAVEFFLTETDELLINEIAPRPHNSGHHTIECNITSQFSQHLRAILNLPLGDPSLISAGAMINLLGEADHQGKAVYYGLENVLAISGVHPHIYGKEITKPFRKMGHVTITGSNLEEVKQKAIKLKKQIFVAT